MAHWYVAAISRTSVLPSLHTDVSVEVSCLQNLADWSMFVDPRQRLIGNANKENVQQALRTLALLPFTRRLGMTMQEVDSLVSRARSDAANPSLKAYFPL